MKEIMEHRALLKKIESAKAYCEVLASQLQQETIRLKEARIQWEKEVDDVEKLQHLTLSSILLHFRNDKEERMAKEEKEAMEAAIRYKQVQSNVEALQKELEHYQTLAASHAQVQEELQQFEYAYLQQHHTQQAEDVDAIKQMIQDNENVRKELEEALQAGYVVSERIENILKKLDSAQSWGVFDILGGDIISSMLKHERIDEAQSLIANVQLDIQRFQKELQDVSQQPLDSIEIGKSLVIFDIMFDNIFSDFMVQNKISESNQKIRDFQKQLEQNMKSLHIQLKENKKNYDDLQQSYTAILQSVQDSME